MNAAPCYMDPLRGKITLGVELQFECEAGDSIEATRQVMDWLKASQRAMEREVDDG